MTLYGTHLKTSWQASDGTLMTGVIQHEKGEDHEEDEDAVQVNVEGNAHVDELFCIVLALSPRDLADDPPN